MTLGISEGEELVELMIRVKGVGSQFVQRPYRPRVLLDEQLRHGQARPDRCCGATRTSKAHRIPRLP